MEERFVDLQTSHGKDTEQRESLDARQVQPPDGLHGQRHDGHVEDEAWYGLGVEEALDVETVAAGDGSIPLRIFTGLISKTDLN